MQHIRVHTQHICKPTCPPSALTKVSFFFSFSFLLIHIHTQCICVHTPTRPSACPCPCVSIPVPSVSCLFSSFFLHSYMSIHTRNASAHQRICMPMHLSAWSHAMYVWARMHAWVYTQHPSTFFLLFFLLHADLCLHVMHLHANMSTSPSWLD